MTEENILHKAARLQRSQIKDLFKGVFGGESGEKVVFKPEELDREAADKKLTSDITKIEETASSKAKIGEAYANGQDEQRVRRDLKICMASRKELLISALKILNMKEAALEKELS